MKYQLTTSAVVLSMSAILSAQTYWTSPPNAATQAAGSNNTIPWWGQFATYQQVHDAETMTGVVRPITGLAVRVWGTRTNAGRTAEMWLQMSTTKTTAATTSGTFATNLAGTSTMSVFGTQTTWPKFSWSTVTGTGPVNPPAFTIPFSTPYPYISLIGNLCWEWRFKNATINTTAPFDAVSGGSHRGTLLASSGTGCTATGQTSPATCAITTPVVNNEQMVRIALARGAANAQAFLALDVSSTTNNIGWCAPILSPTFVTGVGATDSLGGLQFDVPTKVMSGNSPISVYAQFAFADASAIAGVGLSDIDGLTTPNIPGGNGISRVWNVPFGGTTSGPELATTGSVGRRYGVVILFRQ